MILTKYQNTQIYYNKRLFRIVECGYYRFYPYVIQTLGTHPTAYIGLSKVNKFYEYDYDDPIFYDLQVHGGFTFGSRNDIWNKYFNYPFFWLGWDYAHATDFVSSYDILYDLKRNGSYDILYDLKRNGKKYSLKDIKKDVKFVVNQMIQLHFRNFKTIGAIRNKIL